MPSCCWRRKVLIASRSVATGGALPGMSVVLSVVAVRRVPQDRDVGSVVDDLAVDVQDQGTSRLVGPRPFGGADRDAQAALGLPAADSGEPPRIRLVELGQR